MCQNRTAHATICSIIFVGLLSAGSLQLAWDMGSSSSNAGALGSLCGQWRDATSSQACVIAIFRPMQTGPFEEKLEVHCT